MLSSLAGVEVPSLALASVEASVSAAASGSATASGQQALAPLQPLAQGQEVGVWLAVQKDQDVVSDSVHPGCLLRVRLRIVARRLGLAAERSAQ